MKQTALVLLIAIGGCSRVTIQSPVDSPAEPSGVSSDSALPVHLATLSDTSRWVDSVLSTLSLRERVGQMVNIWTLGDYTSTDDSAFAEVLRWVQRDGIGGVTMSLGTPIEVADKLNFMQRSAGVPLLVASDLEPALGRLEGGLFTHYLLETGGATVFPPAMAIAATGRDEDAYDVARAIAREARAVGIHVNFAPVVDVNNNPDNPVIGTRSFGEDPERVARLSAQFVRGTHDGGLLATAKHFPGHGDTDVDSHVGLPVVTATPQRLREVELVPFRAAIAAGADLVMSAHIALPALGGDSATPATLRPDVMQDLLRDTLGFTGVAITDALTMEGVGKGYDVEQSAVLSVRAGSDILLRPTDVPRAINAVLGAVERGDLSREQIDQAVRRILTLKVRSGLAQQRVVPLDDIRAVVGSAPHRALAQDVAQRAITLVRDRDSNVPVRAASARRTAIVLYMPETEIKAGRAFAAEMARQFPGARVAAKLTPGAAKSQLDSVSALLGNADFVVIAPFVRRVEGSGRTTVPTSIASWIDSVAARPRTAVIAFGNPYVIRQFPRAGTYMMTYGIGDALEIAAARALSGARPISGRTPVSLPGFFQRGDGLTR